MGSKDSGEERALPQCTGIEIPIEAADWDGGEIENQWQKDSSARNRGQLDQIRSEGQLRTDGSVSTL